VKLVEELGTIYMAEHFEGDVAKLLNEYENIDIAGARLTPSISKLLNSALAQGKCVYDSENEYRQEIIAENEHRLKFSEKVEELPALKDIGNLINFLKDLNPETYYSVEGETSYYVPLITLIQYHRPEINLVVDSQIRKIIAYVEEIVFMRNFKEVIQTTDVFTIIDNDAVSREVVIAEKDTDKKFTIYGIGTTDWYTLRSQNLILPAYFGKVKIHKSEFKDLWEPVRERAKNDLEKYISFKRRTMKYFLQEENNDI
jgi:hypothetical protein